MEMTSANVGKITRPHDPDVVRREVLDPTVEIVDLVDRHVPTVARALVEEPTGGRALLER